MSTKAAWPRCASCVKGNLVCVYDPPKVTINPTIHQGPTPVLPDRADDPYTDPFDRSAPHISLNVVESGVLDNPDFSAWNIDAALGINSDNIFDMPFNLQDDLVDQQLAPISTVPNGENFSAKAGLNTFNPESSNRSHCVGSDELWPSTVHTLELLDIFFTRYHPLLPCVHRERLVEIVKEERESAKASPLLWAILAVAAPWHPDPRLQALQDRWLARSRSVFDKSLINPTFPTQLLQAAVWIIFQTYVLAQVTEAWFFLSKSCRLATLLGADRIDCSRTKKLSIMAAQPRDAIELEEQRKAVWALFFLDRFLSCLAGAPVAIDDRYFQVNFPMDDRDFQNISRSVSWKNWSAIFFFFRSFINVMNICDQRTLTSSPELKHCDSLTCHRTSRLTISRTNFSGFLQSLSQPI